jgi:transposase-like protein
MVAPCLILIESDVLDRRVNEQRDGFDGIPEEIPAQDLFSDETVSYEAIYEKIDPNIDKLVAPAGWSRDAVLEDVANKFGVSSQMLADTDTRVRHGDSAQSVAERVLKKYQDRIIADTAEIFDLKEEIAKAEPHSEDFRAKIHELSWRYTSSLRTFDMANLSQRAPGGHRRDPVARLRQEAGCPDNGGRSPQRRAHHPQHLLSHEERQP